MFKGTLKLASVAVIVASNAFAQGTVTSTVVEPSPWKFKALVDSMYEADKGFDSENSKIYLDNYLYATYKHSDALSSTLRVNFHNELNTVAKGLSTDSDAFILKDTVYQLTNSKLFNIESAGVAGNGYLRAYLPTSQASRDATQFLRIRALAQAVKKVGLVELTLGDWVDSFLRTDYVDLKGKRRPAMMNVLYGSASVDFLGDWNVYMTQYLESTLSLPYAAGGFDNVAATNGTSNEIGLGYTFLKNYTVGTYVFSSVALNDVLSLYGPGSSSSAHLTFTAVF